MKINKNGEIYLESSKDLIPICVMFIRELFTVRDLQELKDIWRKYN